MPMIFPCCCCHRVAASLAVHVTRHSSDAGGRSSACARARRSSRLPLPTGTSAATSELLHRIDSLEMQWHLGAPPCLHLPACSSARCERASSPARWDQGVGSGASSLDSLSSSRSLLSACETDKPALLIRAGAGDARLSEARPAGLGVCRRDPRRPPGPQHHAHAARTHGPFSGAQYVASYTSPCLPAPFCLGALSRPLPCTLTASRLALRWTRSAI
jgi:hypothetical protein